MQRDGDPISILIVEDDLGTLKQLEKLFSEELPGANIHTARTVVEALDALDRAEQSHIEYDLAVVDFRLPYDENESPQVNDAICDRIHDRMLGTMVVHITGYQDDPKVITHVFGGENRSTLSPQVLLISKDDVEWATNLLCKVKQFVCGNSIKQSMNGIFGTRGSPPIDKERRNASQ